jgi:hypothetical protein|tara:strand:- start:724 stop:1146 length:423 start_codon:yes stop_codon:yes gene_type:complete
MWSKDKIDLTADLLTSKKKELAEIKKQILEMEVAVMEYFDELSSETNTATMLVGSRNTIKRSLTKNIKADDLRVALGEGWVEPEELEACIRPQRDKIVTEPERVMLTEVNELAKQGGQVADLIEQVTTKTTKSISVKEND